MSKLSIALIALLAASACRIETAPRRARVHYVSEAPPSRYRQAPPPRYEEAPPRQMEEAPPPPQEEAYEEPQPTKVAAADGAKATKRKTGHRCPEFGADAGATVQTATEIGLGKFEGCLGSFDTDGFIVQLEAGVKVVLAVRNASARSGGNTIDVSVANMSNGGRSEFRVKPLAVNAVEFTPKNSGEFYIELHSISATLYRLAIVPSTEVASR